MVLPVTIAVRTGFATAARAALADIEVDQPGEATEQTEPWLQDELYERVFG